MPTFSSTFLLFSFMNSLSFSRMLSHSQRNTPYSWKLHECQDFFLFKKRKTSNKSTYDLAWNYYDFFVLDQCVNDSLVLNSHRYTKPNQRKMHQNAASEAEYQIAWLRVDPKPTFNSFHFIIVLSAILIIRITEDTKCARGLFIKMISFGLFQSLCLFLHIFWFEWSI